MSVCMATTATVRKAIKQLAQVEGVFVVTNREAGTVRAVEHGHGEVYSAIQKGKGGAWIVRTTNGVAVQWGAK